MNTGSPVEYRPDGEAVEIRGQRIRVISFQDKLSINPYLLFLPVLDEGEVVPRSEIKIRIESGHVGVDSRPAAPSRRGIKVNRAVAPRNVRLEPSIIRFGHEPKSGNC